MQFEIRRLSNSQVQPCQKTYSKEVNYGFAGNPWLEWFIDLEKLEELEAVQLEVDSPLIIDFKQRPASIKIYDDYNE